MTLRESPPGGELRVTGVRLPPAAAFRLNEMGIRLGTLAHISQQAAFGGRVIAVGMNGGARSTDGGTTWRQVGLPTGTSAISFDTTGQTLHAGALDGQLARTFLSTDGGTTWTPELRT